MFPITKYSSLSAGSQPDSKLLKCIRKNQGYILILELSRHNACSALGCTYRYIVQCADSCNANCDGTSKKRFGLLNLSLTASLVGRVSGHQDHGQDSQVSGLLCANHRQV